MHIDCIQDFIDKIRGKKNGGIPKYGIKHIYEDKDSAKIISDEILANKPSLICRFGAVEMSTLDCFLKSKNETTIKFPEKIKYPMAYNAGFFPANDYMLSRFSSELIDITRNIDVIGVWFLQGENYVLENYAPNAKLVRLRDICPLLSSGISWTRLLRGKRVLVIHPFEESIKAQYKRRKMLFANEDYLPEFELITMKPVQSIHDCVNDLNYNNWFEALDDMKEQIKNINFDIALIGAGAYGIFLAEYCKALGKKAVHMGGALQLLFGIIGKRWEEDKAFKEKYINEYWIRPSKNERPKGCEKVENGCYW